MITAPNWKYCFIHGWEVERVTWEDVLVLPDDPDYPGEALWLTIDCLPPEPAPDAGTDEIAWYLARKQAVGDRPYWVRNFRKNEDPVGDADMILTVKDFSRSELAQWVKTLLKEIGLAVNDMIESPIADFAGRSEHADRILALQRMYPEKPDPADPIADPAPLTAPTAR